MKQTQKIKLFTGGVLMALTLSMIHLPTVHAEDNCLITTPYQENIESDPHYSDAFYVRVGSVCEIKLYDMDISFANIDTVEGLIPLHSDNNDSLTNVKDFSRELRMTWSGSDDEQEGVDYVEFSPEGSGDDLFGYWYAVPMPSLNPPATFKRNMPITINSAHYEVNGEMREVSNLVLDSVLAKMPDDTKEALMISGVEKQDVSYTGQPVVLEGELTVEENNDGITADDLTEKYYIYDDSDSSFTPIERPTDPGNSYLVEYSFENDNYRALLRVPFTIKDYYTVSHHIEDGHGEISTPAYVDAGGDLHVDIIPADGFKVSWVDYNRQDVTNLLNDDNSLDFAPINEDVEIVVSFIHSYQVTQGNGGTHTIGDNNDLSFVVDKDPHSYTEGDVLVVVDKDYVELGTNSTVKPETQTTTLLSHYLDTLEPGEHKFELYFFDTDPLGVAEATFIIAEANPEESVDDGDDETIVVPNTGDSTASADGAGITSLASVIGGIMIAMLIAAVRMISKKEPENE